METLIEMLQASHPAGADLVVGIPLTGLIVWSLVLLYKLSDQLKEISTILFGRPGSLGRLDQIERRIETLEEGK